MTEPSAGELPDRASRGAVLLAAAVAALVALAIYAPTFVGAGHGFTNYDDPYLLSPDNPAIARGFPGFLELLSPFRRPQFMNAWLPLYYGSLAIDHHLGAGAAWIVHLHSAALHAACAAMVVAIARRLGMGAVAAGVAGVAFAVHPAATENVAWAASRKDVLSFLWMSFAAYAYLAGVERRSARLHVVGAVCLAVSLLAKGTTLVLPLLLAVHALLVRDDGESRGARLRPVVPYALVAIVLTSVHLWIARAEGTAGAGATAPLGSVLVANLEVAWRYAVLLVLPVRQSVEWGIDPLAPDAGRAALGGAVLVGVIGTALWMRRSQPRIAAVLLCAVAALAPFNNVFPRTSVLFAERYAHVALLPVAIAVGALVVRSGAQGLVGAIVLVAGHGLLTVRRLPVWNDGVSLWEDAADVVPQSALVKMQLADAYAGRARSDAADADAWNARAEQAWRDAMPLAKDELARMRAETGLGSHLLTTTVPGGGNTEARVRECVALLEAAERRLADVVAPGPRGAQLATLRINRAAARELLGDADGALRDWEGATIADPSSVVAWTGLARMHLAAGDGEKASAALAKSAALSPDSPSAARDRSKLRLAAGDVSGAKAELEAALAKHPDAYDVLIDLGRLDASLQRPIDAEKRFRRALDARPGDDVARQGIAAALLEQAQAQCARDDLEGARTAAAAAIEFAPTSSAPEQVLGIVARRAGDLEEATKRLRRARDLFPEGVRIREALASVLLERAVAAFDAKDDLTGAILAEEAARADAPAVATRAIRIERGTGGWPAASVNPDELTRVTREAALRGFAYLAAGRAADALPELVVAERGSEAGDPALRRNVLRLLVRARFLTGRADDAIRTAEALPPLFDGLPNAWDGAADLSSAYVERAVGRRVAGDAAGASSDFDRARAALDDAARRGLPKARYHLRRGETYFAEERFVEATREFDVATDADPSDPEPYLDRASVFRSNYLLEEDKSFLTGAERDVRRALSLAPSDPRALAALGEVLVLQARPSEAFPWLQRALLADPSQSGARRLLTELTVRVARSHLEKKELKEARTATDRALALADATPSATVLLGDVFRAEGSWAKAREQYEAAAAAYPGDEEPRAALARFWFDLAHAKLLTGQRREAAKAFHEALAVRQTKTDVTSARDRLHVIAVTSFREAMDAVAAKKPEDAASAFETSVIAEPTKEGWANLGLVLEGTGDLARAETAYARAAELAPGDAPTLLSRADVLVRLGRWDEAETIFRGVADAPGADAVHAAHARRQLDWIRTQRREIEGPK